jgi:hypothetical protein
MLPLYITLHVSFPHLRFMSVAVRLRICGAGAQYNKLKAHIFFMSEKEELTPDRDWLKAQLQSFRGSSTVYGGDNRRLNTELTLLSVETQETLQETLERSIVSQDRLANTQVALAVVGVGIALLQFVGMFILPNFR